MDHANSNSRRVLTLDEAKAMTRAADLVQEGKHDCYTRAAGADEEGDFDTARASRIAAMYLQRVEDKLRASATPVAAHDGYSWRSKVRE